MRWLPAPDGAACRTRNHTALGAATLVTVGTRLASCEPPGLGYAVSEGRPGTGDQTVPGGWKDVARSLAKSWANVLGAHFICHMLPLLGGPLGARRT